MQLVAAISIPLKEEEWELKSYELDAALAKLQKQGKLYREPKIVQLELFESGEEKARKVLSAGVVQLKKNDQD